jgi:arabinogalactan endo-1,4-beta-galactosidase
MNLRYVACMAFGLLVSVTHADGIDSPSPPAIQNAGFETDGTGVATPAGWRSAGNVDADFTEPGGRSSSLRLTHWSAAAYDVETRQTLTGAAPGRVTLRAWVRRSAGDNRSFIEVRC